MKPSGIVVQGDGYSIMLGLNPANPDLICICVFDDDEDEVIYAVMLPTVTVKLFMAGL